MASAYAGHWRTLCSGRGGGGRLTTWQDDDDWKTHCDAQRTPGDRQQSDSSDQQGNRHGLGSTLAAGQALAGLGSLPCAGCQCIDRRLTAAGEFMASACRGGGDAAWAADADKDRETMPATRFLTERSHGVLRFRQQGMERESVSWLCVCEDCVTVVVVMLDM